MGHRFYCFPLIVFVSGGLLSILAAPSAEIKTTECEINNSEPKTLRLVQQEFSLSSKYFGFSQIIALTAIHTITLDLCE